MADSDRRDAERPLALKILNRLVVALSFGVLLSFLIFLAVNSFRVSFFMGMRSISAGFLPPLVITYLAFFTERFKGTYRNYIPNINLFVISTLWTLMLMAGFAGLYDAESLLVVPVVELLFSFTLIVLVTFYKGKDYATALGASYGILTGVIAFSAFYWP
ncbi:MAG: hypothetical protein ACFB8W_09335 [Elainellaceae cyanobacterium]